MKNQRPDLRRIRTVIPFLGVEKQSDRLRRQRNLGELRRQWARSLRRPWILSRVHRWKAGTIDSWFDPAQQKA
jgi:hypothetical protein